MALSQPQIVNPNGDVSEDNYEHIFEELQSYLFPPGSLQSLQIDMSNLQEVLNDRSLFDQKSPPPIPTIPPKDPILEARSADGNGGESREEGVGEEEGDGEGQDSPIARMTIMPWDQLEKMDVEFPEEAVHYVASLVRLTEASSMYIDCTAN